MTQASQTGSPFVLDEDRHLIEYRGHRFEYGVERTAGGLYKPVVRRLSGDPSAQDAQLPQDTEEIAYGTEAEAERHAQQQAIRWVNDRTGDGRGQF